MNRMYLYDETDNGPVHKGTNHIPKAVSDRDPKHDWVRDLNYVHSQALQMPSQSRTRSAHCKVIFYSYCAVRADWPKELCVHMSSESGFLGGSRSKTPFISRLNSLILKSFAFTMGKIRLSNQERVRIMFQNRFLGTQFLPLWTGPIKNVIYIVRLKFTMNSEIYKGQRNVVIFVQLKLFDKTMNTMTQHVLWPNGKAAIRIFSFSSINYFPLCAPCFRKKYNPYQILNRKIMFLNHSSKKFVKTDQICTFANIQSL